MIITIDGPVASGKSSLARSVAQSLGFWYINSGILYRAVAYVALHEHQLTFEDLSRGISQAQLMDAINNLDYNWSAQSGEVVFYKGASCTDRLKNPHIDRASSIIATQACVRTAILSWIRKLASKKDIVIDGRDTGTVVFPNADMKWYITASAQVRAGRWMRDQQSKGYAITFEQALESINQRDERDTNRAVAPLRIAEDAQVIDSSEMTQAQVLSVIEHALKSER